MVVVRIIKKNKELPLLEALEKKALAPTYNYIIPSTLNGN